jgi:hypothetical protein
LGVSSQAIQLNVLKGSGENVEWKSLSMEVGKYTFSASNEAVKRRRYSDDFVYLKRYMEEKFQR